MISPAPRQTKRKTNPTKINRKSHRDSSKGDIGILMEVLAGTANYFNGLIR